MNHPIRSSPRFRLVFLLGVAHCGSTLLGRLLNRHPQVFCGGEMMRIQRALICKLPCSCGEMLETCPFWKPLLPFFESVRYDYRRFSPKLYEQIATAVAAELVLDLSKTLTWKRTRWWWKSDVGYIFLVRDSRGILSSRVRKGKELDGGLRKHRKWMKRLWRFTRAKGKRALLVYYEDLATDTEHELRRIMQFLNLQYVPDLLHPATQAHHFIHSSASGYMSGSDEIRVDERWKRELSPDEISSVLKMMNSIPFLRDRYLTIKKS
jgi:hypothetical protein